MRSVYGYKAAIFDLDGTLVDSMHVWEGLFRDFLSRYEIVPPKGLERIIGPMRLYESAPYMIDRFGLAKTPEEVINEWLHMALHQYENTVQLKDGAAELLRELSKKGLKLAVATSCFPDACEAVLRKHELREYFSVIAYSDDVKRGKAYPDIWLNCADKLAVLPSDCIVFEDFPTAINGVRAAGMSFVAVHESSFAGSFQGDWLDFSAKADIAVKSLRELI